MCSFFFAYGEGSAVCWPHLRFGQSAQKTVVVWCGGICCGVGVVLCDDVMRCAVTRKVPCALFRDDDLVMWQHHVAVRWGWRQSLQH